MRKAIVFVLALMFCFGFVLSACAYEDIGEISLVHTMIYGKNGTSVKEIKTNSSGALLIDGGGATQPVSATNLDIRDLTSVSDSVEVKQSTASNLKVDLSGTGANTTALKVDGSAVTQPVSGSVTATVSGVATDNTLAKLTITQNADLGSNTQALMGGSVTTAKPSYTTAKIQPLSLATDGALRTQADINAGSSVVSGQKDVTTAGTELALNTTTAILSVTVKAKPTNTGYIYVGTNPVTSTTGFILSKNEAVTIDTDDLADVYVDCSVNGEGVSYIAIVK